MSYYLKQKLSNRKSLKSISRKMDNGDSAYFIGGNIAF